MSRALELPGSVACKVEPVDTCFALAPTLHLVLQLISGDATFAQRTDSVDSVPAISLRRPLRGQSAVRDQHASATAQIVFEVLQVHKALL